MTAYEYAQRYIGVKRGTWYASNPIISSMLQIDDNWPKDDEVSGVLLF